MASPSRQLPRRGTFVGISIPLWCVPGILCLPRAVLEGAIWHSYHRVVGGGNHVSWNARRFCCSPILAQIPSLLRSVWTLTIALAMIILSFAVRVWQLILTQGVLYALGGTLLYSPVVTFMDEWFVRRKGFAYGIMWAGTGVGGICVPLIMNWGLDKYGHGVMLRAWAVVLVVLAAPFLPSIKPRIPLPMTSRRRRSNMRFLHLSAFWTLQAGNIFESLGFFIPNIWLLTYARSLGLSSLAGTITIMLLNVTSVFGQVLMGSLVDRLHVTTVVMISTVGTTLSVFLLWGSAVNLPLLCIFSLMYGLSAGVLRQRIAVSFKKCKSMKEAQKQECFSACCPLVGALGACSLDRSVKHC